MYNTNLLIDLLTRSMTTSVHSVLFKKNTRYFGTHVSSNLDHNFFRRQ